MNKLLKSISICIILVLLTSVLFASGSSEKKSDSYKIGVSKIVAHPALDAVEKGISDYLKENNVKVNYDFQNANGDISTSISIAQQLKTSGCDLLVGISTPSAQSLANTFKDKPVIFSAVTDPMEAGLTQSNICGVSDANPVEAQIKLLVDVTGAKTIGNIYSSGEANGVTLNKAAKEACDKLGVNFISAAVTNSSEVKMAMQSIVDRVDAVYIATDNTVVSAFASVSEVCYKNKKALFNSDPSSVKGQKFLLSWGFNYYKLGRKTGEVIKKVLDGEKPSNIKTVMLTDPSDFELYVNLNVAKYLGIKIDKDLIEKASVIIENNVETKK